MFKVFKCNKGDIEKQLTLCLMGVVFLLLVPFSLYRLLKGDMIHFSVDIVMAAISAFVFVQTWRGKKTKGLNLFAVFAFMTVVSVLIYFKGMDMIFWLFPGIIGTYFLIASTQAIIVNVTFIVINTILFFDKLTLNDFTSIYPSLLLVCFFGYVLSKRSEFQNKKLFKLVSEDTLTGIKNRRSFDEKIEELLASYKRCPKPASMLLLDLDYFKKVNDSYGHKKGDQVLIDFTSRVKALIRSTDNIYRFGGEEFVVIANNSSLKDSGKLAESIRQYITDCPSLSKYNVTVSIGVSEVLDVDDADSWFRRADRALYESKASGRNRVSLAKLGENNQVHCEALNSSRRIKSISSKAHHLIKPQYRNSSNYLSGLDTQTYGISSKIDKA